ncbi:c-type cytochrome [Propionibacteriaceae bacterium Y2011]
MRLLSTRRRHPATRTIVLAMALFLMGALYAALAPTPRSSADGGMSTQVEEGKALFAVGCSSCHGLNGEGTSQGPTLMGVGSASVDFQMETGRMPAKAPGQQLPRKENQYTDAEIAAIAAYVDTLGPGVQIPEPEQYQSSELEAANGEERARLIARGGELFRTNCSACHNFEGGGGALPEGRYAPSLMGVEDKHIWEAMRTGPQQMPVFSEETLTDEDTKAIIAYLENLHGQPDSGGLSLGGFGPVGEGLWVWVLGIGGLAAVAVWITKKGVRAK